MAVYVGLAAFVAWRVYMRVRRMVGRQRYSGVRPRITVCLFPVVIVLLLLASVARPENALALVAGVALGGVLGAYGVRLTRFEQTPSGLFYTPNAHLGIALSVLFLGRVAYRATELYFFADAVGGTRPGFMQSPLTLLIFGMLAGYYVLYAAGLLRWERRVGPTRAAGA